MGDEVEQPLSRDVAALIYDTKTQPLASGIRAAVHRSRRLLYTAAQAELVLQMSPDREVERIKLIGQILNEGLPIEGASVALHGPDRRADEETDEEGEFRVVALPKGTYRLDIDMLTRVIGVDALDIG